MLVSAGRSIFKAVKRERRSLRALVLILIIASTLTGVIAAGILYKTAISQKSEFLLNNVKNLARLIDAVAHFDRGTFREEGRAAQATLSQIEAAFKDHSDFGETGEILLGRREGDKVAIFLRYRDHQMNPNLVLPYDARRSEAMRLALAGQTGVGEFTNLLGEDVLAAYTYIPYLKIGLEIRVSMKEIVRPYLFSALIIAFAIGLVILVCVYLFLRLSRPVLEELEKYRLLTEAVVESAQDIIITIESSGLVRLINPAGVRSLGHSRADVEGKDFALLFDDGDPNTMAVLAAIRRQDLDVPPDTIVLIRRRDKTTFPSSITCGQKKLSGNSLTTIVLHDLTARKEAEDTIRHLTHKIIEIKDQEQDAISRELHDTLGTNLVWLKLQAQRLTAANTAQADVKNLMHNFDETIEMTRNLSRSLSPIAIEKLGLAVKLRRLVERANHLASANVTLTVENLEKNFPSKVKFHIFRIVQEALNNAIRHSQADQIAIDCRCTDGRLVLTISDNGIGFETAGMHEGMGLALITERAKLLRGTVQFRSGKNNGTEVKIELPIA